MHNDKILSQNKQENQIVYFLLHSKFWKSSSIFKQIIGYNSICLSSIYEDNNNDIIWCRLMKISTSVNILNVQLGHTRHNYINVLAVILMKIYILFINIIMHLLRSILYLSKKLIYVLHNVQSTLNFFSYLLLYKSYIFILFLENRSPIYV